MAKRELSSTLKNLKVKQELVFFFSNYCVFDKQKLNFVLGFALKIDLGVFYFFNILFKLCEVVTPVSL